MSLTVCVCTGVQGRAESEDHMSQMQKEEPIRELVFSSAPCDGRFMSSSLRCGNVLSVKSCVRKRRACRGNESSLGAGARPGGFLHGAGVQRGKPDVLQPL